MTAAETVSLKSVHKLLEVAQSAVCASASTAKDAGEAQLVFRINLASALMGVLLSDLQAKLQDPAGSKDEVN